MLDFCKTCSAKVIVAFNLKLHPITHSRMCFLKWGHCYCHLSRNVVVFTSEVEFVVFVSFALHVKVSEVIR